LALAMLSGEGSAFLPVVCLTHFDAKHPPRHSAHDTKKLARGLRPDRWIPVYLKKIMLEQ